MMITALRCLKYFFFPGKFSQNTKECVRDAEKTKAIVKILFWIALFILDLSYRRSGLRADSFWRALDKIEAFLRSSEHKSLLVFFLLKLRTTEAKYQIFLLYFFYVFSILNKIRHFNWIFLREAPKLFVLSIFDRSQLMDR